MSQEVLLIIKEDVCICLRAETVHNTTWPKLPKQETNEANIQV